jgi:hypothetical protein
MNARLMFDLAAEAERREELKRRAEEYASERTGPICAAIRKLSAGFTEQDAVNLLSCIQARIAESDWKHTDAASSASEGITDAVAALEWSVERSQ